MTAITSSQPTNASGSPLVNYTNLTSCQSINANYAFFVTPERHLKGLKGPGNEGSVEGWIVPPTAPAWKLEPIEVNGKPIVTGGGKISIAAVCYNAHWIHVFYIDELYRLSEIFKNGDGPWTVGDLEKKRLTADPEATIAASCSERFEVKRSSGAVTGTQQIPGELQVYYSDKDQHQLKVAHVPITGGFWSTSPISV